MDIKGIENMTMGELENEMRNGARFVVYTYCISILILTFKRPSKIHFVKANENAFTQGIPYSLLSFLFGWWGIPWGPIYTIQALVSNSGGGKDITEEMKNSLTQILSQEQKDRLG